MTSFFSPFQRAFRTEGRRSRKVMESVMEQVLRFIAYVLTLLAIFVLSAYVFVVGAHPQTLDPDLRPDLNRVRSARQRVFDGRGRKGGYRPARIHWQKTRGRLLGSSIPKARLDATGLNIPAVSTIAPGTQLNLILHTSQFDLNSSAGTHEQFVDRNSDLIADERTTFDFAGGSYDIAVGSSGTRYAVYSATQNQTLVGVLVVALDTNGDFLMDNSSTYDLQRDFSLPSAAAVVSGTSSSGREFVIVCSSGYYNADDPNDPRNEASPGIILLVRDPNGGGFDNSLSRELVRVCSKIVGSRAPALTPSGR